MAWQTKTLAMYIAATIPTEGENELMKHANDITLDYEEELQITSQPAEYTDDYELPFDPENPEAEMAGYEGDKINSATSLMLFGAGLERK